MRLDDLETDMPGVYEHPDWYLSTDTEGYREAVRVLRATRGKPDATITIYRGAPPGAKKIRPGDWVTTSRAYAEAHGRHADDPSQDWPVISMQVPVRDVYWGGNDFTEFGYWPKVGTTRPASSPAPGGTDWAGQLAQQLRAEFPGLMLDLHRDPSGYIVLPRIKVPEQRRGTGTAVMQRIVDAADANGDTLVLSPTAEWGASLARLTRFYRRFGFIPNKGRAKDFTTRETKIRRPGG
jgi:GNAT superfamily N-acetyltransferase